MYVYINIYVERHGPRVATSPLFFLIPLPWRQYHPPDKQKKHSMVHVVIGLRMEIVKSMQSLFPSFSTSCVTSFCSRMRFTSSSIVFSALMIQWAAFTCPLLSRLLPLAPAWSSRRKDCVELASQHKIDHHCGDGRGCVALGRKKKLMK